MDSTSRGPVLARCRRPDLIRLAALVAMALIAIGCSSGNSASTTNVSETDVAAQPVFDETMAKSALLIPEDLGPTWSYELFGTPKREFQHSGDQVPGTWGVRLCPAARSMAFSDPSWAVGSALVDSSDPLNLRQSITLPKDSAEEFRLIRDAFESCTAAPWTAGDDSKSLESIPAPAIADESTAHFMVTTTTDSDSPGGVRTSRQTTIVMRRAAAVEIYEFFGRGPELDMERFEEIIGVGDAKLRSVIEGSQSSTTTTGSTTTTSTTSTTTPLPRGSGPSCAEVQSSVAQMSPADLTALRRAPMLFFSRPPGGADGWRITALGDVTGQAPRPDVAVYYDWTASSGLGPPVVIMDSGELDALISDGTSITLLAMECLTPS